jgi:hypothetical protein
MRVGEVAGIPVSVEQGLQFKRIDRRPSDAELASMFEILWKPAP